MKRGGIILCGGKSVRMGVDKATLSFGHETMLERMVSLVGQAVGTENIVVVASWGQSLPVLPSEVSVAYDEQEAQGPLEAVRCGFLARDDIEAAYVSGCDTPLLMSEWIECLFARISDHDVVVAKQAEFYFPLSAVYHRRVLPVIESQLAAKEFALNRLFGHCDTLEVEVEHLRDVDPELQSLLNVNRPEDYQQALKQIGLDSKSASGYE